MEQLPVLFKKSSKGKIQVWAITVSKNNEDDKSFDLITRHGFQEGKQQTSIDTISNGKNVGKANETTPEQQAYLEAKSKWQKQIDRKGYVENVEDVDKDLRPGAEAMLAHRYDKYPDKITYPAFIQPKLDGHRCIAVVKNGYCKLYSRQRKEITGLPHIVAAVEKMCGEIYKTDFILDGELYNHEYKDKFEQLTGFIRSESPKDGYEAVQYHIYDMIVPEAPYLARLRGLNMLFYNDTLHQVRTERVKNDEDVMTYFKEFRQDGYEGAILRNSGGLYVGKRSYDLQKVKEFDDAEYPIIDIEEGRGAMKGHAIFVCQTPDGENFKAKMKGELEKLKEYFENPVPYIGKYVTIQYQGLTNKGIPRFPVAIRFREDV